MNVVIDANVLIAAVAAHGLCEAVVEVCLERHRLILGTAILDDVAQKLKRKLKLPASIIREYLAVLEDRSEVVEPEPIPEGTCRDPDDHAVLGLVVPGKADAILSGDKDLLVLKAYKGCPVLSPREFWEHAADGRNSNGLQ
jgi:putative toxin-antitoxin system toxin component, PIN family